ncbi:cupincin-like [Canna indica]|uniref:Cupincin-like n=1 Tax=Canna indica TaxID=4628 RepID=A0AAQ3L1N6_9LILI|nr:cupincin-like [Canna indica]
MAATTVQFLFPLLLLLLSSILLASATSVNSDHDMKRCHKECKAIIPEGRQLKECVRQCVGRRSSERESRRDQQEGDEQDEATDGRRREHNPYYFSRRSFRQWVRTKHGHLHVLERFSERSELLLGVENYRLAYLEAEPKTFIVPSHWDAEQVIYVMQGHGTITLLDQENRDSYEIRRGDIMRIPAGSIVYAINEATDEKLRVAMLLHPISTPGEVEEYIGAAGRNPETFYTSFSNEVLEAAFNTPRDKLERLFGQQRSGQIVKINDHQIRRLSRSTRRRGWAPFARSNEPYNLLNKRPSDCNQHGELYAATAQDYHQLHHLNSDVYVVNITQGSMMAPHYNSRSPQLAMVMEGTGYFEMVCPHDQSSEHHAQSTEESSTGYRTMRSRVSCGSAFVIPAGHPAAIVAAPNENLQVLSFGLRADSNTRYFLAGSNNVLNRMEREAKELAFGVEAEEVDEVLNAQPESVFLPGPKHRRHREEEERDAQTSLESLFSFLAF